MAAVTDRMVCPIVTQCTIPMDLMGAIPVCTVWAVWAVAPILETILNAALYNTPKKVRGILSPVSKALFEHSIVFP